jgi:outer membrane protein OmpU
MRETMKKILLAASALALTAGAAAADVRLSGYARFGIDYNSTRPDVVVDDRWRTTNRFRLQVDVSTTTDTGLTFGARQRFQIDNGAGATGNQVRFFAQFEGLTVAFGNILGVIESMPNLYLTGVPSAGVGLNGNGFHSLAANTASNNGFFGWTAYSSGGASAVNGVEAIYTFGDFTIHGHMGDDRSLAVVNGVLTRSGSRSEALGVRGTFADVTVGLGYERWRRGARDGDDILFASAGYNIGDGNVSLSYARTEYGGAKANKWSLSGGWNVMPDLYTYGFVARENNDVGTSYGLGASYALGGGASFEAGYTRGRDGAGNGLNIFSTGIFFSF